MIVFREEVIGDARLILADCHEVELPREGAAIVSDPPYGVKTNTARGSRRRTGYFAINGDGCRDFPAIIGDDRPFDPAPWLAWPEVILWGANHYADKLPTGTRWLVWDKRRDVAPDDNGDCELAWTNLRGVIRKHSQLWRGLCREGEENIVNGVWREHPTQKPVALMAWCVSMVKAQTIVDPYLGSGTTGVAAVRDGRAFVGCEMHEPYFDVACRRIEQAYRQPRLFAEPAPKPSQMELVP